MANKLTSTKTFTLGGEPGVTLTDEAVDQAITNVDAVSFAERSRLGRLNADDEYARVNGWLGGTQDDVELHSRVLAATGGHDNVNPVTNPQPPAVASEAALHPGVSPDLVLPVDYKRALAAHEAAKAA